MRENIPFEKVKDLCLYFQASLLSQCEGALSRRRWVSKILSSLLRTGHKSDSAREEGGGRKRDFVCRLFGRDVTNERRKALFPPPSSSKVVETPNDDKSLGNCKVGKRSLCSLPRLICRAHTRHVSVVLLVGLPRMMCASLYVVALCIDVFDKDGQSQFGTGERRKRRERNVFSGAKECG